MGSGKNFPYKNGTYAHINSNLGHLTEVLVGFSTVKLPPRPNIIVYSLEGSHYV